MNLPGKILGLTNIPPDYQCHNLHYICPSSSISTASSGPRDVGRMQKRAFGVAKRPRWVYNAKPRRQKVIFLGNGVKFWKNIVSGSKFRLFGLLEHPNNSQVEKWWNMDGPGTLWVSCFLAIFHKSGSFWDNFSRVQNFLPGGFFFLSRNNYNLLQPWPLSRFWLRKKKPPVKIFCTRLKMYQNGPY